MSIANTSPLSVTATVDVNPGAHIPTAMSKALTQANTHLMNYLLMLKNDTCFLPVPKDQVLGRAFGKAVSQRLGEYDKFMTDQASAFQGAIARHLREYQKSTLANWRKSAMTPGRVTSSSSMSRAPAEGRRQARASLEIT